MTHRTLAELQALLTESGPVAPFDLDTLRRAAAGPHAAELMAGVREEAARGVAEGPPAMLPWSLHRLFGDTGDRLAYEKRYFARRRRLAALALAALTHRGPAAEGRALHEALADMLWSVCDEYTWALPAHTYQSDAHGRTPETCVDLFACESAHTLAEVVFLLAGQLPDPVAQRVRAEIRRRVLDPLYGDPRPWPWESFRTNWSAVCGGAAGMAALLIEDDPALLAAALDRALRAMDTYLSGLSADGGCAEGISYWAYGFGYFTLFAEALRARTGIELLADHPLAALAARFPAAVALGPDHYPSFSDSPGHTRLSPGLITRLRERCGAPPPPLTGVPHFGNDHCYRWSFTRDLAWTDPAVLTTAPPTGTSWLPHLGWLTDRRTTPDGLAVAFAAKGGHNDEPHNHNDLGHFILTAGDEQLLADLGPGEYRDGYFGPDRYTAHLHPSAEAHSVPVVDGHPQRPGPEAMARVLRQKATDQGARLELDLTAAYDTRARVHRAFDWRADGRLTLTDAFTGAETVDELFISHIRPEPGHGSTHWRGSHGTVRLTYDPACWQPTAEEIPVTDHHGGKGVVHRLRLSSHGPVPARAVFELRTSRGTSRAAGAPTAGHAGAVDFRDVSKAGR